MIFAKKTIKNCVVLKNNVGNMYGNHLQNLKVVNFLKCAVCVKSVTDKNDVLEQSNK